MRGPILENRERTTELTGQQQRSNSSQLPVHLLMMLSQILSALYYVVTKVALVSGMNLIVLSLYRDILATLVLATAAYFMDKGNRLKLSWDIVFQLLLQGLTGPYGGNILLFLGIQHTSAEASAAVQPFTPALTALIAILCGVEVILWRRRDGQVKMLGIVASCSGAILMTFYRGPAVLSHMGFSSSSSSSTPSGSTSIEDLDSASFSGRWWHISGWKFGSFCLLGSCICLALYINIQARLLKRQPAPLSVLAYSYGFGACLMALTGFFAITDTNDWALSWDVRLATVIYNGVIAAALNFGIQGWCLARVGPLFVSSYIPMQPVVAAALAFAFLGTIVFLGSIVGTILILSGLLLVSWSREEAVRLDALSRGLESRQPPSYPDPESALNEPLIQIGH